MIKRRVPEVQLPFEDAKVLAAMVGSSMLSAAFRRVGRRSAGDELMVAVLGLAPAALALRDSHLAAYHGVEHKAIAGYEQGTDAADDGQGARPLRLQPRRPDADLDHGGEPDRALRARRARTRRRAWR